MFKFVSLIVNVLDDDTVPAMQSPQARQGKIAIFGASGTAGVGILKAALANPEIKEIQAITRRATPMNDVWLW